VFLGNTKERRDEIRFSVTKSFLWELGNRNGLGRFITLERKENSMKKSIILVMVVLLAVVSSVVMADENGEGKAGRLFLFQKCDKDLIPVQDHDSFGCPNLPGPWPVFFGNDRYGKMDYTLWGPTFKFSFQAKNLLPEKNYTLIYYPDPWPGDKLICLGSGKTTSPKGKGKGKGTPGQKGGNIEIHGDTDIGISLPANDDANHTATSPSGAVGAKIWLVLSEDVQCPTATTTSPVAGKMLSWNPAAYLFEYNLIVYERRVGEPDED
jgi:hypothetical protein